MKSHSSISMPAPPMNQQLRDPSELVGALLVEATAVHVPHNPPTQTHVAPAVAVVHDAIAIPSHHNTHVSNDDNERELANIATQRGRLAAAAEIAAIRDSNQQQQHLSTAAVREIPTKSDVDELQYTKNETGISQATLSAQEEAKGCFGSGHYEVQEYVTTNYNVADYNTKEYKSVYDA